MTIMTLSKARIKYLRGSYRHTIERNTVLKFYQIPTKIAGENALWRNCGQTE